MREKYQSLALTDLKEIAKSRGIKGTSSMKKADVIEAMLALDEQESRPDAGETETVEEKKAAEGEKTERKQAGQKRAEHKPAGKKAAPKQEAQEAQGIPDGAKPQEEAPIKEAQGQAAEKSGTEKKEAAGKRTEKKGTERKRPERQTIENRAESRSAEGKAPESRSAESRTPENRSAEGRNTESRNAEGRAGERKPARRFTQNTGHVQGNGHAQNAGHAQGNVYAQGNSQGNAHVQGGESAPRRGVERTENRIYAEGKSYPEGGTLPASVAEEDRFPAELDSGIAANGILEVMPDGYGFIRCANYLPGENDVYVAPSQIRRFGLKTGDIIEGNTRVKTQNEKFSALLYVKTINGYLPDVATKRCNFEDMTPIFPDERIKLELSRSSVAMRIMDLMSPVGKGQRGMIVSPPKAGKTTLLKQVAQSVKVNNPDMHLIILLIDERPEEVTDFREAIEGPNVEVIYSTFDELPEHHKRVSEMVIERAKRLVEHKKDVMILLDSITRLTRAYNLVIPPSGRTLSGGLDPAALHMPKRFFGAARNMREGGSLTILATALVDTGSKMDDVIYEEFKGTGNMEIVLDRKLSERRVFPAIDIPKSGTRREDLLLSAEELEATSVLRKALNGMKPEESVDKILDMFTRTRNNTDFVNIVKKMKFV